MMAFLAATVLALIAQAQAVEPIRLTRGSSVTTELTASEVQQATLQLRHGETADLVVLQQGIDVVVELFGPRGALLETVDSPNGRQGPEPLSLFADRAGLYQLRIRPIAANEPRGRITVNVTEYRDAAATRRLLQARRRARETAAQWLRRRSDPLPANGRPGADAPLPAFDALAAEARIVGLGEATHGSRELNDIRLALMQRLVERHGYRLIALEDSATRWRTLEPYWRGAASTPVSRDWGWIGARARQELLEWVRQWNVRNPTDPVRIVGVDPQDDPVSRDRLGAFLARAYGPVAAEAWREPAAELAAADAQVTVFGDSGTSPALRQFMQDVVARLTADAALLRARFGEAAYREALEAALDLAAFVDFNSGRGTFARSRDWYMAELLTRAMEQGGPKAIYWAHNAHVSAAPTSWGPTGALLRQAFGCGYRAVATSFGAGDFVAQVAGDPGNRLERMSVAAAAPESETVETVLASIRPGAHLSAWGCDEAAGAPPEWLSADRRLRWIGGVYAPDSPGSAAYQPYRLTDAFDAIAYFPTVAAEEVPTDRPVVPLRQRASTPGR